MNRRKFLEHLGLGSAAVAASAFLPPLKPEELKSPLDAKAEMFRLSGVPASGVVCSGTGALWVQVAGRCSVGDYMMHDGAGRVTRWSAPAPIAGVALEESIGYGEIPLVRFR